MAMVVNVTVPYDKAQDSHSHQPSENQSNYCLASEQVAAAAGGGGSDPTPAGGGWSLWVACPSHEKWLLPTKTMIASWFGGGGGRNHKPVPTISDEMEW